MQDRGKHGEVIGEDGLRYCAVCGEKIERAIPFPLLDGTQRTESRIVHVNCRCRREEKDAYEKRMQFEEKQRRMDDLRKLSLMDAKTKQANFRTYKITEENSKIFNIAKKYVDNFDEIYEKSQGILFWGDVGTGKSHIAATIANELIERMNPVIMTSFIKLLNELMQFSSGDKEKRLFAIDYVNRLNEAKLLVIDDLGAERGTDFALEKVYDIIDSRYRAGKPLILTTNMTVKEMQETTDIRYKRIYDRIFEMCFPVRVAGQSWREKEAAKRFDEMKRLMEG